jgi:hypothetical protein
MNELLKKIIKNAFQEDFEKMQTDFIESLALKDMTDEEIIQKFKHTKWKEANNFEKKYLKIRYGFVESFFTFPIAAFDIFGENYIADKIKETIEHKANIKKLFELKNKKTTKKKGK